MDGVGDGAAAASVGPDLAGAESLHDDLEPALRQRAAHAPRARLHDGWARRVQTGGVGGREQQAREPLGVGESVRRDAPQVGEYVLEGHCEQIALRWTSGATNVPRIVSAPSGSK